MAEEKKDEVETIDPSNRPPFIELKDNQIIVKTFNISMSRSHKWLMVFDLLLIGFVCGMFSYVAAKEGNTPAHLIGTVTVGIFLFISALMKTMTDFINWKFTMNSMLRDVGGWYMEDVRNIVSDLINAGARFADEEVARATGKEIKTEKEEEVASESEKKD